MKLQVTLSEQQTEKELIQKITIAVLRRTMYDVSATAHLLSRDRSTIARRARKWGMNLTELRIKARAPKWRAHQVVSPSVAVQGAP